MQSHICTKGHGEYRGVCNFCRQDRRALERAGKRVVAPKGSSPTYRCGHVKVPGYIQCRQCKAVKKHEWYVEHAAEEIAKASALYYQQRADGTYDQSRVNEAVKRHRAKHPDRTRETRAYYESHRDEQQVRVAAWKLANPEKHRAIQYAANSRRKARLRSTRADLGSHTHGEWLTILAAQDGRCNGCGLVKKLEKDHIQPLSRGGSDTADNLQGLCRTCNGRKSNRIAA